MIPTDIKLTDLLHLPIPEKFKLHLAAESDGEDPLDAYVRDRMKWIGSIERRNLRKNEWTRSFVLSFILFRPSYKLRELAEFAKWEGRLVCRVLGPSGMRGRSFYLENYLDQFTVDQILPERHRGE